MKRSSHTTRNTIRRIEFDHKDLVGLVTRSKVFDDAIGGLDKNSILQWSIKVPSGGDYSGDILPIDSDMPLILTITDKEETSE